MKRYKTTILENYRRISIVSCGFYAIYYIGMYEFRSLDISRIMLGKILIIQDITEIPCVLPMCSTYLR